MKPPPFEYACPKTLEEAVNLLASRLGNAKVISGGQSLVPMMAFRLAAPELLVDIKDLQGLNAVHTEDSGTRLGAKVRWCDIERDQSLRQAQPLLAEAVKHIAHYQVRNRGTIGGSLAHADPSAELPGIAVTCEARITIVGAGGQRVEEARSFFAGSLETTLEPDEIITELLLPAWPNGRCWAFVEFSRRKGDFALAGVALFYDLDECGRAENSHVGAIGISDRPVRLAAAEAVMNGQFIVEDTISAVSKAAMASIDPPSDIHAPGAYRRALLGTLLERALRQSAA